MKEKIIFESLEKKKEGSGELALGILPDLIGRQLRIAQLLAFKDFSVEVEGRNLTPGSFEILELLDNNPGLGQTRIASVIGLDKSSLVPALTRLETLGLVMRKPSAIDKRANELRITSKGRKMLETMRKYVLERELRITRGMSKSEIKTLNRLLIHIARVNM